MNIVRTCTCLLAAVALAGCATASHAGQGGQHAPATGHLTGTFVMEGGALGPDGQQPGERPIPGTVIVTDGGRHVVRIQVGGSGRFSAWLRPGRYQVSGRSPNIIEATRSGHGLELPCSQPLTVTITAGHAAAITLTCIVPLRNGSTRSAPFAAVRWRSG
jgi:hypothetical protein